MTFLNSISLGCDVKRQVFPMRYLHFADNQEEVKDRNSPNCDKLFKVRKLLHCRSSATKISRGLQPREKSVYLGKVEFISASLLPNFKQ